MSKINPLDSMLAADGELGTDAATRLGPDAAGTAAAIHELGELVRGDLELAADEAEPRLAGLWDLVERRLDREDESALVPVARPEAAPAPSTWARLWSWLGGHRSHIATGLVSAGAVAALALALRPPPSERVVVKTVQVPSVAPIMLARTPPEVESLDVTDGSGTVFTFEDSDDDGVAAVIWIEPTELDPTEGI
ncbi:MAG: hypothetical protein IPL61_03705 [Myxococcales bacterium]|nr:hypothetical protein [Myxococcales bacterium]